LHTADKTTAQEFADKRSFFQESTPEIHKIECLDNDAVIYNLAFDYSTLNQKEVEKFFESIKVLSTKQATKYSPILFEERKLGEYIEREMLNWLNTNANTTYGYVTFSFCDEIYKKIQNLTVNEKQKLNIVEKTDVKAFISNLATSHNTNTMLANNPNTVLFQCFGDRKNGFTITDKNNTKQNFRINLDACPSWMEENHIVGIKWDVHSATLHKDIEDYCLCDTFKICTQEQKSQIQNKNKLNYDEFTQITSNWTDNKTLFDTFSKSPEFIMKSMKEYQQFKKLFELDAGVWEKFTIGEHTETVLTLLDKSYNELPQQLVPFVKFAFVLHDIGKGVAVQNGDKNKQKEFTKEVCKEIFDELQIENKYYDLFMDIICGSQNYTSKYYVSKDVEAIRQLNNFCDKSLTKFLGRTPTQNEIRGMSRIARILQNCDSGAYTRFAVTRAENGIYYKNGNDMSTQGFEQIGWTKKGARFKEDCTKNLK